ncbi:alpha-hydroxy acid oxidase [Hydrotalea sp.]|uniref:alpha-hydroxy acid oxidase n=1 Tax=Hydrotalea sp. TaxID=2881279 RepID=UPI0026301CAC|nr:alpha-hydroxy acid oxidase [Hydrotalea sp.]
MKENEKILNFNPQYPSVQDLKKKAKQQIPKFAFDYLEGGCNEDVNLFRNKSDLQDIILMPQYLKKHHGCDMSVNLFGHTYDAPVGIAPIGLQGLIWPKSPEILAKAALKHNIPFILSTVSTSSIERIAELSEGRSWFQLYHPADNRLRDDIIKRIAIAQCPVLVVLVDVPSFGYRPRDIKNGLAMPPKMSVRNVLQAIANPKWSIETLRAGIPGFATLKPYMPENLNLSRLGQFMNATFTGRVDVDKIAPIRDMWKGSLVLKGVVSEEDTQKAIALGADGIIVSNHGGRQLDAAQSTIKSLKNLSDKYGKQIKVMIDGGLRSGPDISRALASGAEFTFMGRPFMYGVGALGKKGGDHTISILKVQLQQIMEQLGCEKVGDFPQYLIQ